MENIYYIISIVLIVLGIAGVFLPVLPGPVLVLAGISLYGYLTDFTDITIKLIIIFSVFTAVSFIFDYFASFFTAKKFGVSKWGIIGMFFGGFAGFILFNIIGLLLGQFIGIAAGELLTGKSWINSVKSGGASLIGYLLSVVVKIIIVGLMVGIFAVRVLWNN